MLRSFIKAIVSSLVIALAVLSWTGTGDAHHAVLRYNLEEMTYAANRVFVGRCVTVEETQEMVAGGMMPVTLYTFEVERAIKGRLPKQLTFRQLGHPAKRAYGKENKITMHGSVVTPNTFFHGLSEYRKGDRLVLFLIPDYLGGKVTRPAGLYQGAFFVSDMPSGERMVRNSINNLGLFTAPYTGAKLKASDAKMVFPDRDEPLEKIGTSSEMQSLARKRGGLPLDSFLEVVERIVEAHGGERGVIDESQRGGLLK